MVQYQSTDCGGYDSTLLHTSLEGFMIFTDVISLKDDPPNNTLAHPSPPHKHPRPPSLLSVFLSPSRSSRASAVVHSLLRRLPTHTTHPLHPSSGHSSQHAPPNQG